jgi:hypothetical protein
MMKKMKNSNALRTVNITKIDIDVSSTAPKQRSTVRSFFILGLSLAIVSLAIVSLASWSQAQVVDSDLTTHSLVGISKSSSPSEAAREVQAKLMAELVREQTMEIVGEAKYKKNLKYIENRSRCG